MFVAPCVHHTDDGDERFAEWCQKIFRFHRNRIVYYAAHDPNGFQFAELLHQHAPRRTLYRMLKLHGTVDALGHAINQIGLPFRAHDILRNRHAAVEIYRGYLIFVHTLQMYINPAIREKNHTVINLSHIAVV